MRNCRYVCVCIVKWCIVVLHIEFVVPVRFASFTYNVSEGSSTSVTVHTIGAHDFAFTVFLIIADGECQSVMDSITVHSTLCVLLQQGINIVSQSISIA